jgi:hypothetical protein
LSEYKKKNHEINEVNSKIGEVNVEIEKNMKRAERYRHMEEELSQKETDVKGLILDSTQQKKSITNM